MPVQFSTDDLRTPESLERVLRQFQSALDSTRANSKPMTLADLAAQLAPLIRDELQATGKTPLNLQSLLPALGLGVLLEDTHANRLTLYPASNYTVGTVFYETDRTVVYAVTNSSGVLVWQYIGGVMYAAFSARPTDLSTNDAGFLYEVSDHLHFCRWSGTAWAILDNDAGIFVDSAVALGTGYQLCDGTATTYLAISGTDLAQTAFTTPDENTAPAGVYHKSIAAYTGTINAAVAPTLSGSSAAAATGVTTNNESAHTHAVTSPTAAPSATATVSAGLGATVASDTHTHTITSPTGAGSAHNHGITDPTHTHGVGTYVVSSTAQPRNMGVLRYFRR